MKISKRLETVASYVPKNAVVADIGSDHAYLPCYLVEKQQIKKAIAGEVVIGPFQSAKETVEHNQYTDYINVRLGNGLDVIQQTDGVTCITICGMGGELITNILEQGKNKLKTVDRLILQPNVGEKRVRKWLVQNHYMIVIENILEENGKIYEIIVADKTEHAPKITNLELEFGKFLILEKSEIFQKKWHHEIDKYNKVIASLRYSKDNKEKEIESFEQKKRVIREVLNGQSK